MADLGHWFKLWCSVLDDPDLSNLSLEQFARWAKLGALLKRQGTDGELVMHPPSGVYLAMFQAPDFETLMALFHALPGVDVRRENPAVSNGTTPVVSYFVSLRNWARYQGDFSTQRVRAFRANTIEMKRSKRRREETRREEKRGEESAPPLVTPIAGGSDTAERKPGAPWSKVQATRGQQRKVKAGSQSITIPAPLRPIVDAYTAGFRKRFNLAPTIKPWDLDALADLVQLNSPDQVLKIVEGCLRAGGTPYMEKREKWSLRHIADEWNALVVMERKGDLR